MTGLTGFFEKIPVRFGRPSAHRSRRRSLQTALVPGGGDLRPGRSTNGARGPRGVGLQGRGHVLEPGWRYGRLGPGRQSPRRHLVRCWRVGSQHQPRPAAEITLARFFAIDAGLVNRYRPRLDDPRTSRGSGMSATMRVLAVAAVAGAIGGCANQQECQPQCYQPCAPYQQWCQPQVAAGPAYPPPCPVPYRPPERGPPVPPVPPRNPNS
jgi:hypothetical protein